MVGAALVLVLLSVAAHAAVLPFMDPALSPEQRAKDLVARLMLEDQVGLLLASNGCFGLLPTLSSRLFGSLADRDSTFAFCLQSTLYSALLLLAEVKYCIVACRNIFTFLVGLCLHLLFKLFPHL